jgi:hypothetical protein
MKKHFFVLLLGSAFIAVPGAAAFAQDAQSTTQNPFDQPAPQPGKPAVAAKKTRGAAALKAGQFASESEAKASCPGDTVVWANLNTKVYHHAGAATYGKTKRGAYMCEKETGSAGFRAAKNEKQK